MSEEEILNLIESILEVIFDSIEVTVGLFSRPTNKYIIEMFIVVGVMLGMSSGFQYTGLPVFISVYECLYAEGVLLVFIIISYINKVGIDSLKKKLRGRRDK